MYSSFKIGKEKAHMRNTAFSMSCTDNITLKEWNGALNINYLLKLKDIASRIQIGKKNEKVDLVTRLN